MTHAPAIPSAAEELANLRRMVARLGILPELIDSDRLTDSQAAAVLTWWRSATGGLQFSSGFPGIVGVRAYSWLQARAGAQARGIDTAERLDSQDANAMTKDLALHLDWLDTERYPEEWDGQHITELDVNGQFLGAAGIELGTGDPELIVNPRTLDGYLPMPGYVRVAQRPDNLAYQVPFTFRAFDRLQEGSVLAMPTVRWLLKNGVELDASQVLVWPKHRRHLASWQRLFGHARFELAGHAARGTLGAYIALALVKEVANVTLGGWLRSDMNASTLMRRDWSDQIITEAAVRAWVGIERAGTRGDSAIGQRRDAVWYVARTPHFEPSGLQLDKALHPTGRDGQLGKWKRTRSVRVDQAVIAAYSSGSPEMLVRALVAADRAAAVKADLTPR